MTSRRCHSCRGWYDALLRSCPVCGTAKHAHNTWLAHARMNGELHKQVEHAVKTQ